MRLGRLVLAGASLVLLAACGGGTQGTGAQTVGVTLDEYHLKLDSTSVAAGTVTFQINNLGKEKHEFVILRTDLSPTALPIEGDKVLEEASGIEHVDEIDEVVAGGSRDLTVTLKAGSYVLVCNYVGHAHGGMVTTLTVK